MVKPKIPYGYYRDPRTGRLRKKQTRRKQTGKGHTRKQHGKGLAAAAIPLAKLLAPVLVPLAIKEGKKLIKRTRGGGLRLMGQNQY